MSVRGIKDGNLHPQKKQNKKRSRKRYQWIKRVIVFLMLGATAVLLGLSPLFNIDRIEVVGQSHCNKDAIIGATDIMQGSNGFKTIATSVKNLFQLRYREAEKDIQKSNPYIKSAKVKFVIPNKVKILVEERTPAGIIPYLGTHLLIDPEGYVLDTLSREEGINLPLIKGIEFERYELGQALVLEGWESFEKVLKVLDTLEASDEEDDHRIVSLVTYIDVKDTRKIHLYLDSRVLVNLGGTENLEYKIRFLKQIFYKNIKKEDRGYLDFTAGENPKFTPEETGGD